MSGACERCGVDGVPGLSNLGSVIIARVCDECCLELDRLGTTQEVMEAIDHARLDVEWATHAPEVDPKVFDGYRDAWFEARRQARAWFLTFLGNLTESKP